MKSACSRAEGQVYAFGVSREWGCAIPAACTAVHAFFPVKRGRTFGARTDGLAGTGLNAYFRAAGFAQMWVEEQDMVGVARRGLDLTS